MSLVKKSTFRKLFALLVLIGLWECTSRFFIPSWPAASQVLGRLMANLGDAAFCISLFGSLQRMLIGYLLVVSIGVTVGLLLGRFSILEDLAGSLTVAIHSIPGAAWVPLAVLWFGFTEKAVIATVVLGSAGIVMVNTDTGIRNVPLGLARAAKTMGAKGFKYFWFVVVPAAIPQIVDGLRLAWAFGWRALMAGELLISVPGLGQMLNQVAREGRIDDLLSIMIVIAIVGITVDGLVFKRLENTVRVRWGLA